MSEPFLSEIKMVSFNFAPKGWAQCDGQLMRIDQNQALFSLLGVTFGGDGRTTFALPNLKDRVPIHVGNGYVLGEAGGAAAVTLTTGQMPSHQHLLMGSQTIGDSKNPSFNNVGNVFASDPGNAYSNNVSGTVPLNLGSIGNVGGSQAHTNEQPYLTIMFCIATQGIFPSQS